MPSTSNHTPPSQSTNDTSMETNGDSTVGENKGNPAETCNNQTEPQAAIPADVPQTTEKPPEENLQSPSSAATASPTTATDSTKRSSTKIARHNTLDTVANTTSAHVSASSHMNAVSEWSHQQLAPTAEPQKPQEAELEWQDMPAFAPYDIYDDDNRLIARENEEEEGLHQLPSDYSNLPGFSKGYTRVQLEEDAQSASSFDDNTAYLFKDPSADPNDDDQEARDVLAQMKATKDLLSGNQRIAYVGLVRLAMSELTERVQAIERTKKSKKPVDYAVETMKLWSQKMMVRLYSHMELEPAEQIMIEQLAEHGLRASDLSPTLKQNARVKNPLLEANPSDPTQDQQLANKPSNDQSGSEVPVEEPTTSKAIEAKQTEKNETTAGGDEPNDDQDDDEPLPVYEEFQGDSSSAVDHAELPLDLPQKENLDIDIRWTVLCDLFLILIADSMYDSRSRTLFEKVGAFLDIGEVEMARFEKRVTEALEMEEESRKEDWNEAVHMEERRKRARKRRLALMGLATVGGGLVIGLSAGLLAPVIGAGLASGFGLIGITGTEAFLAGVGGATIIAGGATVAGGTIGVRAANRRTGAVKTFEYRPLHNNHRANLIVTVAGWMSGKVDDVRLPFSTIDPVMGDVYSIFWEPEMLRSMGDTINILATEALTQGLQQILGSTILISLMAALQLPVVLSKLSYLIDNPWSVSLARADMAGLILADSLIDRNLGARPITLVGFSIGSRVIYAALRELANKGAVGLIQDVVLFGNPVVARKDEFLRARTVVSGRFVNGYAKNDWILGYLFRATAGGIGRVAGLAKVEIEGVENIDVTEHVPGHMAYRQSMPKLLQHIGWAVTSLEFTEIEDPDPENHERRQRELINEIEEARKEIQEKKKKKRFDIFGLHKKWLNKREWETYDDRVKNGTADGEEEAKDEINDSPIFDIDAIRKEAALIAAEGLEIKELESTMPPLRIDSTALSAEPSRGANGTSFPYRATQSYEGLPGTSAEQDPFPGSKSDTGIQHHEESPSRSPEEPPSMSFEPVDTPQAPQADSSAASISRSPSPNQRQSWQNGSTETEENISMTFDDHPDSRPASPLKRAEPTDKANLQNGHTSTPQLETNPANPPKQQEPASPVPAEADIDVNRNVWADEEDEEFGKEKEMTMTFE